MKRFVRQIDIIMAMIFIGLLMVDVAMWGTGKHPKPASWYTTILNDCAWICLAMANFLVDSGDDD